MTQRLMFGLSEDSANHMAHRDDPDTSREAARDVIGSGALSRQRQLVLQLVRDNPDSTSAELAAIGNVSRHLPARRLIDLVRARLVKVSGRRRCNVNGTNMQTYVAI